jgi:hypothetical protein
LLEFDALLKRKKAADNKERFNAAIVAAAVCNTAPFGDPNRKPVSPLDFVPDWKDANAETAAGKETDLTKMSPEEQKNYILAVFGNLVVKKEG